MTFPYLSEAVARKPLCVCVCQTLEADAAALLVDAFIHFVHVSLAQIPFNLSHPELKKNVYKHSGKDVTPQSGVLDTNWCSDR